MRFDLDPQEHTGDEGNNSCYGSEISRIWS